MMPVEQILSSEILHINVEVEACLDGQHWQWDGVKFQMLNPSNTKMFNRNDYSCVLKVTAGGKSVLMTGDIGHAAEARLLREYGDDLESDIMIVPHHGSMTSSTREFVNTVAPDFALFSVGYRNRYGFPKSRVVKRYRDLGSQMLETAYQGAIRFELRGNSLLVPMSYRHSNHRYWNYRD
ncbi:MAG: DNA internalization-related competence protein ComEC/Rec2, partial [Gammaproteobacteria bacterium]|nr:DNA internalization-related competence protein ComEC/Rec2 [Gammaproteobacteria bacterium]